MYCSNCGNALVPGQRFCANCGAVAPESAPPPAAAPAPIPPPEPPAAQWPPAPTVPPPPPQPPQQQWPAGAPQGQPGQWPQPPGYPYQPQPAAPRSSRGLLFAGIGVAVAAVIGVAAFFLLKGGDDDKAASTSNGGAGGSPGASASAGGNATSAGGGTGGGATAGRIVFENTKGDLVVANLDGSGRQLLLAESDHGSWSVSRDGTQLLWNQGGYDEVSVSSLKTFKPVSVYKAGPAESTAAGWSPDGRSLLVDVALNDPSKSRPGTLSFLYTVEGAKKTPIQLPTSANACTVSSHTGWTQDSAAVWLVCEGSQDVTHTYLQPARGGTAIEVPDCRYPRSWWQTPTPGRMICDDPKGTFSVKSDGSDRQPYKGGSNFGVMSRDGKLMADYDEAHFTVLDPASGRTSGIDVGRKIEDFSWSPDSRSLAILVHLTDNEDSDCAVQTVPADLAQKPVAVGLKDAMSCSYITWIPAGTVAGVASATAVPSRTPPPRATPTPTTSPPVVSTRTGPIAAAVPVPAGKTVTSEVVGKVQFYYANDVTVRVASLRAGQVEVIAPIDESNRDYLKQSGYSFEQCGTVFIARATNITGGCSASGVDFQAMTRK